MPYYLSKKRRKGRVQLYLRREDQSLWEISQLFGVQLSSLKKINKDNNTSKIFIKVLGIYNFIYFINNNIKILNINCI